MEEFIYAIYQKLGGFFTGKDRRCVFYALVLSIFVIAIFVIYNWEIMIEKDTLYWLFSSMAQSLAALIAVLGVVIIFKHQSMSTREDRMIDELSLINSELTVLQNPADASSGKELLENIERHLPSDPDTWGNNEVKLHKVKMELESIVFARSFLSDHMLKFSVFILAVILLNFILLIFVPILASINVLAFGSLYLSLFLAAYASFLVAKVVANTFL